MVSGVFATAAAMSIQLDSIIYCVKRAIKNLIYRRVDFMARNTRVSTAAAVDSFNLNDNRRGVISDYTINFQATINIISFFCSGASQDKKINTKHVYPRKK